MLAPMVYVVPLLALLGGIVLGVLIDRHGRPVLVPLLLAILGGLFAWAIWKGRQMSGWDGIGYAIFAVLMVAPVGMGLLGGWLVAMIRRRRAARSGPGTS